MPQLSGFRFIRLILTIVILLSIFMFFVIRMINFYFLKKIEIEGEGLEKELDIKDLKIKKFF